MTKRLNTQNEVYFLGIDVFLAWGRLFHTK